MSDISNELAGRYGQKQVRASAYYGKKIVTAKLYQNEIFISFEGKPIVKVYDDGQSCCESRYISTDDDPLELSGQTLVAINVKDAPDGEHEYGSHGRKFVEIQGNKSSVTFVTHNEHNGYYGGFGLTLEEVSVWPV